MYESGQGWREVDDSEYEKNVSYYTMRHRRIEYDQPYSGDFLSVAMVAKIVGLFEDASEVMIFIPTDLPKVLRWKNLTIKEWRIWSAENDMELAHFLIDRLSRPTVFIHPLKDDWFMVHVNKSGYYKCDQFGGLANLVKHLYNK
jgi:hypothetical protein